jgi:hypothetical protein
MKRGGFSRKKAFRVVASPSLEAAKIKFAIDYAALILCLANRTLLFCP